LTLAITHKFPRRGYFSMVTYTTLGYGDVVLRDRGWRLLGGVEALTGSLMLCWSTVILVHVVTRIYQRHAELWEQEEMLARGRLRRQI
jgi:Ion channel